MVTWIAQKLVLEKNDIRLSSLRKEHIPDLWQLAQDERIWRHYIYDCSDESRFKSLYQPALEAMKAGREHCFVIEDKAGNLMGSTRFLAIDPAHRKLEIGWTWLHPDFWGTDVNRLCKWLLLKHCFEALKTVRVQVKTDENNERSRKAILKTGAKFEGILRNEFIRDDCSYRNSAYYSITEEDWPMVKHRLQSAAPV